MSMLRELLRESFAFARENRRLTAVLLCGPMVLLCLFSVGRSLGFSFGRWSRAAPWTSDTLRFDSLGDLVEYRLTHDPELDRLRAVERQQAALPLPVGSTSTESPLEDVIVAGGAVIRPPAPSDPGLAAQLREVLIDSKEHESGDGQPSLAGDWSEDASFHGIIEHLRSTLGTKSRKTVVVEYSIATERYSNGIPDIGQLCPFFGVGDAQEASKLPPGYRQMTLSYEGLLRLVLPGGLPAPSASAAFVRLVLATNRNNDFEELAGLANGHFFGVVVIFPLLDMPFSQYPYEFVHRRLENEVQSAGLRVLDILPYIRSLDVADFRSSYSSAISTPYANRVYAHIIASYLECARLIPSSVFVVDRSGCSKSRPTAFRFTPVPPPTKLRGRSAPSTKLRGG